MTKDRSEIEERHSILDLAYFEQFSMPPDSLIEEKHLIEAFRASVHDRFMTTVVIGRFQPLHRGHVYAIKQAAAISDRVVIGIGSANIIDNDNPFSFSERQLLITRAAEREGLEDKIHKIVPLFDHPDDTFWLQETLRRTGRVEAVVGNNAWVNSIFENAGLELKAFTIPRLQRNKNRGTTIRQLAREQGML